MKKPWSIATTLRNPERLQGFLRVLNQLDGLTWDSNSQKKFQILLIQNRLYGYDSTQFYNTLTKEQISLLNNISKEISFSEAESIFLKKRYKDPAMRGRQSINPLRKLGFVYIRDKKIFITSMGKLFLKDSSDLGEVFLKSFLKWQIPNLDDDQQSNDGYDIKPFVGTLHLIDTVNKKESINGNKAKGISKKEFALFVPTLVHYNDIDLISDKIIALRSALHKKTKKEQKEIFEEYRVKFATEFLGDNAVNATQSLLNNLDDYGDNAIRYFRLTRYIHIRGNEFYIDIEPRRSVEIESLLQHDNAQSQPFNSKEEYFEYISDVSRPQLPWETKEKYTEIIVNLINDIQTCEADLQKKEFTAKDYRKMDGEDLKKYIGTLREYRRTLEDEKTKNESQETKNIEAYITSLKNIFDSEDRSLLLEKMSALSLFALNDALKVKPNYPVGDDNEPTFTAPANTPDIECFYETFNAICEVTVLTRRDQWYHEGQPVMRHLRDFEDKYNEKPSYCLFLAPNLHRDTINTFWQATKYEYEGKPQRIVPLSINQFISVLNILLTMKSKNIFLRHEDIMNLYDAIVALPKTLQKSDEWLEQIPKVITSWGEKLISGETT